MVAKINSGKSIIGILNYNENKVKAGVAECVHENLYGQDVARLTFYKKLEGLTNYSDKNRRAVSKAVHISLNFHPDEKLDVQQVRAIADTYMDKIGFGEQPYLVYRHNDAAHPHIHIVTTNINRIGQRIVMYNIGRNQSEKARQEIEKDFKLITAAGRRFGDGPSVIASAKTDNSQRAVYGKSETKRTLGNAVTRAMGYKFTSLPEFNAVLKQFNVVADPGREGTMTNKKKGLVFFMLDKQGNKIGVPIKASSFYNKPTIANLEKLFRKNEALRLPHRDRVKQCIDQVMTESGKIETRKFLRALNRERIFVLFRKNADGVIYGITFVDNRNKVVFNGSDLGKAYSAKAITERLINPLEFHPHESQRALDSDFAEVLSDLTTAQQYGSAYDPYQRRKKRKKLKRSR